MRTFEIDIDTDTDADGTYGQAIHALNANVLHLEMDGEQWPVEDIRLARGPRVLNLTEAGLLGQLLDAASRKTHVARLMAGTEGSGYGDPVYGTARAIVVSPERPHFPGPDDDVRDGYLWVTTRGGFEMFWPVSELVQELKHTTFVVDYEPPRTEAYGIV